MVGLYEELKSLRAIVNHRKCELMNRVSLDLPQALSAEVGGRIEQLRMVEEGIDQAIEACEYANYNNPEDYKPCKN